MIQDCGWRNFDAISSNTIAIVIPCFFVSGVARLCSLLQRAIRQDIRLGTYYSLFYCNSYVYRMSFITFYTHFLSQYLWFERQIFGNKYHYLYKYFNYKYLIFVYNIFIIQYFSTVFFKFYTFLNDIPYFLLHIRYIYIKVVSY